MSRVSRCLLGIVMVGCLLACLVTASPAATGTVTLSWTAPADGDLTGGASVYDLRYSLTPITASNFGSATPAAGMPAPRSPGSPESFTVPDLVQGDGYYFAIKAGDRSSNWSAISNVAFKTVLVTDPLVASVAPWISAPWPSPVRDLARWSFALPRPGLFQMDAFDLAGRHVRRIADGWRDAGQGDAAWDLRDDAGRAVPSGIYAIRATVGGQASVDRVVVAR